MRFKQTSDSQLPEVDLIPMLNVMMGILAFFVMITMMLTIEQSVDVQLPDKNADPAQTDTPEPMIVQLDPQQQILVNDQPVTEEILIEQMQAYLANNSEGVVALKADLDLMYEPVIQLLGTMREIGGDRVSLVITQAEDAN
ncbi:MAG: ExbD/TolR family protein [Thainema sp.]